MVPSVVPSVVLPMVEERERGAVGRGLDICTVGLENWYKRWFAGALVSCNALNCDI